MSPHDHGPKGKKGKKGSNDCRDSLDSLDSTDNKDSKDNKDYKDGKRCQNEHRSKSSCRESINEILSSVAKIERALANAINVEANLLKREELSSKQISFVTNKLEELLKLAIKKEIILESLLQEAIKACENEEKHSDRKK